MTWLALDIGGANLKAAHSRGMIRSAAFALWKEPQNLAPALVRLIDDLPPFDRLAVTMTGELCDCFRTKAEGVESILTSIEAAFPDHPCDVWGNDGRFLTPSYAISHPMFAAASNWLALAQYVAETTANGLLIDIGSTTSDLIPIRENQPVPRGRADTDRLRSGELIYAGVKRTPLCALATALPFRGEMTGLAAELFATTGDVYVVLGDLMESPEDHSTADGRPATREFARERLARMVGADRDGFTHDDALAFAQQADATLTDRLIDSARRVAARSLGGPPPTVVVSGSGEFLAHRVASRIVADGGSIVKLSERWGHAESDAACAYALMLLAKDRR